MLCMPRSWWMCPGKPDNHNKKTQKSQNLKLLNEINETKIKLYVPVPNVEGLFQCSFWFTKYHYFSGADGPTLSCHGVWESFPFPHFQGVLDGFAPVTRKPFAHLQVRVDVQILQVRLSFGNVAVSGRPTTLSSAMNIHEYPWGVAHFQIKWIPGGLEFMFIVPVEWKNH